MNGKIMILDEWLYGSNAPLSPGKGIEYLKKIGSWMGNDTSICKALVEECNEHDISIVYMLALAQKEQSALWRKTPPSQRAQDWLYGYGCPESGGRMAQYKGAINQIRSATAQLRRYDKWDQVKNFRGRPVKIYDNAAMRKRYGVGQSIVPDTKAEAASLLYNPRIEGLANQAEFMLRIIKEAL